MADASQDEVKQTWDNFLSNYQDKIASGNTDAVIVLHGACKPSSSKISKIEMIIVDGTKIARLVFTDEESEPSWSDDGAGEGASPNERKVNILDEKLTLIHRILNGDKQKVNKPKMALFNFGSKPAE